MRIRFDFTLYINKRVAKKLYKLYTNPTFWPASRWFSVSCEMYSLRRKLYTNYTLNYTLNSTQRAFRTLHSKRLQNYTRGGTQTLHFVFERESRGWKLEREWSESYVTFVTNVTNETNVTNVTNVKQEMAIGGDAPRHSCAPRSWKSNNFERFFGDSTLTFLTYRNTFRLPILPFRRIVFLCLPQILLCLPLIFLCLPLILPGCASKIPDFKGKVTKKGGSRGSSHISVQI